MKKYIILCVFFLKGYVFFYGYDLFPSQGIQQKHKDSFVRHQRNRIIFYKPFYTYIMYNKISNLWVTDFKNNLGYGGYCTHVYKDYKAQWGFRKLVWVNIISIVSFVFPIVHLLPIIGFAISLIQIYHGVHYFTELLNIQIPRFDFLFCEHPLFQIYYRFDYDFGYKYIATTDNTLIGVPSSGNNQPRGNRMQQDSEKHKVFYFLPGVHLLCMFSYEKKKIKPFLRVLPIGYNFVVLVTGMSNICTLITIVAKNLVSEIRPSSVNGEDEDTQNIHSPFVLHKISFIGIEGGIIFGKIELCLFFKPSYIINKKNYAVYNNRNVIFSLGVELKLISS
ncbi:MAG: hypothetical protein II393_01750 [Cytophagales bacterium]|nr:hypothetical protein [Cytophagales bacterium]